MCDLSLLIVRLCYIECARGIIMCTITATELKRNFGKYMKLGQIENIEVTHRGETIFVITPKKQLAYLGISKFFGTLPNDVDLDNVDRE